MKLPKSLSGFIWYFIKQQSPAFLFIIATSWVWAINESLSPYFLKSLVNHLHEFQGNRLQIWAVLKFPLLGLTVLWILMEVSMRTQGYVMMNTFPKLKTNIRETVFDYVRQHSHDYFANHFAGEIASKIDNLPSGVEMLLHILLFNFIAFTVAFIVGR